MRRTFFTSGRLLALLLVGLGTVAGRAAASTHETGRPIVQGYPPGLHLRHPTFQTMVQDEAGRVVFANGVDVLAFDGLSWTFLRLPTESEGVQQFARADDGTIYAAGPWVIGYLRGRGNEMTYVSLVDQLPAGACDVQTLRSVAAVGDTVAFADARNILLWREGKFSVLRGEESSAPRGLRLHAVGAQLLVTAPGRPLCRVDNDRLVPLADDPLLRENQIVAIVPGRGAGELLLLTAERGFLTVGPGGVVQRRASPMDRWLAGERVFRARQLPDGSWAVVFAASSGWRGLLFGPDENLALRIGKENGIYADFVRDLVPDREGGLWAMLDTGAVRLEWPGPVSLFDAVNGLSQGAVRALARHEGALFATTDDGIFRLRPAEGTDQGAKFELVTAPPSDALRAVLEASRLSTGRAAEMTEGLPHFVRAALGEVTCAWEERTAAGRVRWLGGAQGLVRWELERGFPPRSPLPLRIAPEGVARDRELQPEHDPITFRLEAVRQQRTNRVAYRTRLVGRDVAWSAWSPQAVVTYPHLPPGRYAFQAQARDADGIESPVQALGFTVLAPWWMTPWAFAGYAVSLGLLVFVNVRWRTRALARRAAELEALVARRTAELAEKNAELARLYELELDEKVAARLAEEKARLEVLRYQLNPHFLFNALASISGSLPPGAVARGMVEQLAEFCRLTLRRADADGWTTLGEEMRLLRAYLAIEQTRWADLLAVELRHDPALDDVPLPYFLLLPLMENALKYGRATSPDRVGLRLVTTRAADGGIDVEVANTGAWVEPAAARTVATLGIGLANLRQRLARCYPQAHRLDFSAEGGWVTARLHLGAPVRPAVEAAI
jgi:hypothetical protein